ncbi:MAG: hypothetical protein BroJett024_41520 [Alphaproteobacteria bacterium]|nr:MAG: hypothetical protein BroJett024_41520 [Alphaproteobacteria bacterium]
MRPAYLRPEGAVMRAARQADLAAHQLRAVDLLALAIGYGLLLSMCVAGFISLIDAIQGNPQTVLPQIAALLARMD